MCSLKILLLVLLVECGSVDHQSFKREMSVKTWRRASRGDAFENWFNVYDPSFLSLVWPKIKNGVHLLLDVTCWDDVSLFMKDLADGRAWAYDAVDASGRYPSGLFTGSRHWFGSKDKCLRMDKEFTENGDNETLYALRHNDYMNTVLRKEKYYGSDPEDWRWMLQHDELMQRLVAAEHWPPHRLAYSAARVQLNVTKLTMLKSYDIILGVCLPRSCSTDEIESLINFSITLNDNLRTNKSIPRITKITSLRQIDGHFDVTHDIGAILLIVVSLLLVILAITATVVDFDLLKCVPYNKKSMSFDLPMYNNHETKLVDEIKRKHIDIKSIDSIMAESANMNLVTMKKLVKTNEGPSPITLDVVNVERVSGSCNRCGRYKRQCTNNKQMANLPACPRVKYSSFASLSTEDKRKTFFCNLLLCFSFNYSWNRIFNKTTANKDLSFIHGLKVLATFWIIFLHVAVLASYTSDDTGDLNERENIYYILATGTIAFDTLFFVSGLFSSHHFFYLKSRYSVKELVSFGGACGQVMQFVCFVTNRVIRLLPSYAYTILLSAVLARVSMKTALLSLPEIDHDSCPEYWWRNLLYVSTAYPRSEQISWFLTTETQLHALGALICASGVAACSRAKLVAVLAGAMVLATTAADVSAAYFDYERRYSNGYEVYSNIIERPWARVAPYFVGVLAGWLVHTMHGRLKMTKLTSSLLWSASLSLVLAGLSLPFVWPAWLAAWIHMAWSVALLWPVLLATTHYAKYNVITDRMMLYSFVALLLLSFVGFGIVADIRGVFRRLLGHSGVAALSRLSYSSLLLHGAVARFLLLGDSALCSHFACIWMYFAGTIAATLLAALLLSLLIEMPCCSLLRRLSDSATT